MHNFFICDLETGGLNENANPITEVAILVLDYRTLKEIDFYQSYVKPYNNLVITNEALQSSNVSMKDIQSGNDCKKVAMDMVNLAKKHKKGRDKPIFVGHKFADFDIRFLKYLFAYLNKNLFDFFDEYICDTIREIKRMEGFNPEADKNKNTLGAVCERYGIELKSAHGAESDIRADSEVFRIITNRMRNSSGSTDINNGKGTEKTERIKQRKAFQM